MIESGRRFVSIADQQTGSPGSQQQPVGTTVALLERGMKVMSAIHKRLHYAQKTEFRMLARLIRDNMPPAYPYAVGTDPRIKQMDFDDRIDVLPVSDPNIFSMAQRVTLAQTQLQLAQSNPQMHNLQAAYKRMYQALEVQNIDEILPPTPEPKPTDPGIENARALAGEILTAFPDQDHDAHIAVHVPLLMTPLVQASPSVMGMLMAHCMEHISFKARNIAQQEIESAMQQMDPQMAQMAMQSMPPAQIEAPVAQIETELIGAFLQAANPVQGEQQDPLVAIRQQELAIKAMESERRAERDRLDMNLEQQKLQQKAVTDAARIESTEDIANQRAEVNRERIEAQQRR